MKLREALFEHRFEDENSRDLDRFTVYRADGFVARRLGRRHLDKEGVENLVACVALGAEHLIGEIPEIRVSFLNRGDALGGIDHKERGKIWIPKWAMNKQIVLHELAHALYHRSCVLECIRHREHRAHGRIFRATLVHLLREYDRPEYGDALRARYIHHNLITPELT